MAGCAGDDGTARRGLDLARQVAHVLRERGATRPVPILGGIVVEARAGGRARVYWRLPGPPLFEERRRRRQLRRCARLLRGWGVATELHVEAPESYVDCWIKGGRPHG